MADPIQRLVQQLARLPGIGEKTATRLALHIVRGPAAHARELAQALIDACEQIRLCSQCMNLTEHDPCALCADPRREGRLLCVVASPSDLIAIERGRRFTGRYHVLHGLLSPLEGIGPDDLRIAELLQRVEKGGVDEVILATSANVEGEATAMYLARLVKATGKSEVRVTRIASGIPVGGELEYADQATIARALDARSEI